MKKSPEGDQASVPSTHIRRLTTTCNSSSQKSSASVHEYLNPCAQTQACTHTL
ncbi:hypothetical protein LEMLEM_LOCUS21391, partial [Lemmus lemmus]